MGFCALLWDLQPWKAYNKVTFCRHWHNRFIYTYELDGATILIDNGIGKSRKIIDISTYISPRQNTGLVSSGASLTSWRKYT